MAERGTQGQADDTMTDGGVLRRLLAAGRAAQEQDGIPAQLPQALPPTPAKAAALAVGRVADRLYRMATQPISITPGTLSLAELPELLPQPALLAVLEGPGDALGVMALSPDAVTALIEVQALGRITNRPTECRRPTRSDAMLCADFVNALLTELSRELTAIDGFESWTGYRYASHLDDPRPLLLMLDDLPLRSITMHLRLGGPEGREAQIFTALPLPRAALHPESAPQDVLSTRPHLPDPHPVVTADPPRPPAPHQNLGDIMRGAPVELIGILCRRTISLGELRALAPGRVLALPRASLNDTRLETPSGQLLARGKLGEVDGCHAIRLHDPAADTTQSATTAMPAASTPAAARDGRHPLPVEDLNRPDPFRAPSGEPAAVTATDIATDHADIPPPNRSTGTE